MNIFVDFDRTLFNTELFQQAAWEAIDAVYGIDVAAACAEMPKWYRQKGDLHYYSMDEQLAVMFPSIPPDTIREAIRPRLTPTDFTFPDTTQVFAWQKAGHDVRIITFGEQWFQETKRSFVPTLAHLPFHVTLQPKGDYITQQFPGAVGVMVDDKRNTGLSRNIKEIWLKRDQTVDIIREDDIIIVNSLKHVQEVL